MTSEPGTLIPDPEPWLAQLRAAIRDAAIAPSATLILAVSGGADSMALLHLIHRASLSQSIEVIHVDHGLRPDAAADAAFVAQAARTLGYPCAIARIEGLARRADGGFSEAEAREARWRALYAQQARHDDAWLVLAHQMDDQAETLLLNLMRGAGLSGLAAMRACDGARRILRPLLQIPGAELRAWLRAIGQDWREDLTNAGDAQLRNRLRQELSPVLTRLWDPGWPRRLAQTATLLRDDEEALAALATAATKDCLSTIDGEGRRRPGLAAEPAPLMLSLAHAPWAALPAALASRVLRAALAALRPALGLRDLSQPQIAGLAAWLRGDSAARPDLPGALRVERGGAQHWLYAATRVEAWSGVFTLKGGGELAIAPPVPQCDDAENEPRHGRPSAELVSTLADRYNDVPWLYAYLTDARSTLCLRGDARGIHVARDPWSPPRRLSRVLAELDVPAILRERVVLLSCADGRSYIPGLG